MWLFQNMLGLVVKAVTLMCCNKNFTYFTMEKILNYSLNPLHCKYTVKSGEDFAMPIMLAKLNRWVYKTASF